MKRVARNTKGLTLLEVMVASFILALVAVPLLSLFANSARLVQTSYQRTDVTYKAKSLMEKQYGVGYAALFARSNTMTSDSDAGKYYKLTLAPAGPSGVVAGTAAYFHLIISSSGTGYFVGPDGKLSSNALLSISSGLDTLKLDVNTSGAYKLSKGSTQLLAGIRPSGATPVLVILSESTTTPVKVTLTGNCAAVAYCAPTMDTSKLSAPNAASFALYNNDAPPTTLLVSAVMSVYKSSGDTQPESVYQNTLSVGSLP